MAAGTWFSSTEFASRKSRAEFEYYHLAIGIGRELDVFVPLLEQALIEFGTVGAGVGDDLALGERRHEPLGKTPLQNPAERHRDDIVVVDLVEGNDLVGHGGPERGDAAGLHSDPLAANEVGEGASIEKVDFDFIMAIRPLHLLRLPDLASEAIRREVAAMAVKVMQRLGLGNCNFFSPKRESSFRVARERAMNSPQDLGKELKKAENTLNSAPTDKMADLSIAQFRPESREI